MKFKLAFILAAVVALASFAQAQDSGNLIHFKGTVTAVDSNGNKTGRSFTAVDDEGKVKIFYIDSLAYLDKGDRVVLSYYKGNKYPLSVARIKFLPPTK